MEKTAYFKEDYVKMKGKGKINDVISVFDKKGGEEVLAYGINVPKDTLCTIQEIDEYGGLLCRFNLEGNSYILTTTDKSLFITKTQ